MTCRAIILYHYRWKVRLLLRPAVGGGDWYTDVVLTYSSSAVFTIPHRIASTDHSGTGRPRAAAPQG